MKTIAVALVSLCLPFPLYAHHTRLSLFALVVLLMSPLTQGHHSLGPYDRSARQEIEGVITRSNWRNPHLTLELRTLGENGAEEQWEIEADAINTLLRRGMVKSDFGVGETIRFFGFPTSRGRNELFALNVLLPDGREFRMLDANLPLHWTDEATQTDGDQETATDIFRVWSFNNQQYERVSPFVLTPGAELALEGYDPLTDQPALRCIAPGLPNAILNPYPIEFVQEGQNIRLRIEEWGAERLIDMTSTAIPGNAPLSRLGYSIGRWEGNTLEVTTGRLNSPMLDDDGIPMSTQASVVERFTLLPEDNVLRIDIAVTDPVNLQEPAQWTFSKRWNPDTILRPFECRLDEG